MYSNVDSAWQKFIAINWTRGIVNEDQQHAWLGTILEPPVV